MNDVNFNEIQMSLNGNDPIFTISNAAKMLNTSVYTLRMYEREGLIIPFRKKSNQRLYSEKDIERVRCIQNTINVEKINIEGTRRILALLPCWSIIQCSGKDRKNCEYYSSYKKPCWMFDHKNNMCEDRECRNCEVYKSFGSCSSIKNKLKELLK